MKFNEISQGYVTELILEAVGKNTHLEHLEDHIFNKGFEGAKEAINYLSSLHEMLEGNSKSPISMTTKWDGAPAIIAGRDPETGKFFVGTKGVFATRKPKINFTEKDIDENHPAEGLRDKLKLALRTLSKLNWNTVAQGDMLFSKEDLQTTNVDGEEVLLFKPNTIVYAVPTNSDLAKEIASADIGIVWHTEYVGGPTLADTRAKFGFNADVLGNNKSVWHRDAIIKNLSGVVTFTKEESIDVLNAINSATAYMKSIDSSTFNWLEQGNELIGKEFLQQLKAHVNNNIRAGAFDEPTKFAQGFIQKYVAFMTKEIDKVKQQSTKDAKLQKQVAGVKFIRKNLKSIVAVYDLYLKIIEAKIKIIRKLEIIRQMPTFKETENGYEVTAEEGFVAVDRKGNALKLVDRLEFSKLNFGTGAPGK